MKTKIAILTDSSSSIYNIKHEYNNIFMINLPCFLGSDVYTDFEKFGNEQFYNALKSSVDVPKTSQPSMGEVLTTFEMIKDLGYTDIVFLCISKELSGTYQNAMIAKEMIDDINIEIVDTLTTVSILTSMVLDAARISNNGGTVADILKHIDFIKQNWQYFLTVDNLTYLIKNGRLSNAKGLVANILKIKPVIEFSRDGKLISTETVRTYKKALIKIVDMLVGKVNVNTGVVHVSYTDNTKDLEFVLEIIKDKLPNIKIEVFNIPATVVAHLGLSVIGVGYINY